MAFYRQIAINRWLAHNENNLKYYGPAILWALFIFVMCTIDLGDVGNRTCFFPVLISLPIAGSFLCL